MANYIARTVTENPAYMQAQIKVPAGETYHAGQVVVAVLQHLHQPLLIQEHH